MQSQADWQVVDPAKIHHEKQAKSNTVDMMDQMEMSKEDLDKDKIEVPV